MDANARDLETALPVNARAQSSRTSVPSLLFISSFIILYLLTSHNGDEFLARHHYQDALQTLSFHLSNYSAWINGTASNFSMVRPHSMLDDSFIYDLVARNGCRRCVTTGWIPHSRKSTRSKRGIILPQYNRLCTRRCRIHQHHDLERSCLPINERCQYHRHRIATRFMGLEYDQQNLLERDGEASTRLWRVWLDLTVIHSCTPFSYHGVPTFAHTHQGRIELSELSDSDNLKLDFEGVHFTSDGSIFGLAEAPGWDCLLFSRNITIM